MSNINKLSTHLVENNKQECENDLIKRTEKHCGEMPILNLK